LEFPSTDYVTQVKFVPWQWTTLMGWKKITYHNKEVKWKATWPQLLVLNLHVSDKVILAAKM
jgi:hypothetical protein